jgi:hypothetical protein
LLGGVEVGRSGLRIPEMLSDDATAYPSQYGAFGPLTNPVLQRQINGVDGIAPLPAYDGGGGVDEPRIEDPRTSALTNPALRPAVGRVPIVCGEGLQYLCSVRIDGCYGIHALSIVDCDRPRNAGSLSAFLYGFEMVG